MFSSTYIIFLLNSKSKGNVVEYELLASGFKILAPNLDYQNLVALTRKSNFTSLKFYFSVFKMGK